MWPKIGRRLEPPEGVKAKVGDRVTYELIYEDGQVGTISTIFDEFDLETQTNDPQMRIVEFTK